MIRRVAAVLLAAGGLALALRAQAEEMRQAVDRPDILEVGDPILISRRALAFEMRRNIDLRDWVRLYGAPDYTEEQDIQIDPPWAPYEVRLYYLKRNAYVAFGRVNVAPNIYDYGVRKYIGTINPAEIDRLLTAQPLPSSYASARDTPPEVVPAAIEVQTVPVEGVPVSN